MKEPRVGPAGRIAIVHCVVTISGRLRIYGFQLPRCVVVVVSHGRPNDVSGIAFPARRSSREESREWRKTPVRSP